MRTFYQVWRLSPTKDLWFRYNHIPDCDTAQQAQVLFQQHRLGVYRGNQFKPWMQQDQFKIVKVIQSITDEINPV
jgi:hypothetical protein